MGKFIAYRTSRTAAYWRPFQVTDRPQLAESGPIPLSLAGACPFIFAIYRSNPPFWLNDFQRAKSNEDRRIQVRILCAGSSGCGD